MEARAEVRELMNSEKEKEKEKEKKGTLKKKALEKS